MSRTALDRDLWTPSSPLGLERLAFQDRRTFLRLWPHPATMYFLPENADWGTYLPSAHGRAAGVPRPAWREMPRRPPGWGYALYGALLLSPGP